MRRDRTGKDDWKELLNKLAVNAKGSNSIDGQGKENIRIKLDILKTRRGEQLSSVKQLITESVMSMVDELLFDASEETIVEVVELLTSDSKASKETTRGRGNTETGGKLTRVEKEYFEGYLSYLKKNDYAVDPSLHSFKAGMDKYDRKRTSAKRPDVPSMEDFYTKWNKWRKK